MWLLSALGPGQAAGWSTALSLFVGQLASAPGAHPPKVSVVGPSPLIWVHAPGLQVSAWAAYPAFTVKGLRGEGRQKPWLLRRVLTSH